jgi:mRNA-degrading endonuclease RelE of RelBE toxin-antitoxin system
VKLQVTERFARRYRALPREIQERVDAQLELPLENPRHPSLRSRKMQGTARIWELRVTQGYRLTFQIEGDVYLLRTVGTHDILREP